jgi:single-strand DNA-binding protein
MSNINTTAVSGNLTRDPELKTLPSGTTITEVGIAVNRSRKEKDSGEYVEEVSFFELAIWSGFGELVARKLRKGDSVTAHGRLEQQRWETPEGENRSKIRIVVEQMDSEGFFRPVTEDNTATPAAAEAEAAPAAPRRRQPPRPPQTTTSRSRANRQASPDREKGKVQGRCRPRPRAGPRRSSSSRRTS